MAVPAARPTRSPTYIFRVYRDRSNVGYGTMLAMVYLLLIIVFITLLLNFISKRMQKIT